jgi:hypothetical protein
MRSLASIAATLIATALWVTPVNAEERLVYVDHRGATCERRFSEIYGIEECTLPGVPGYAYSCFLFGNSTPPPHGQGGGMGIRHCHGQAGDFEHLIPGDLHRP